MISTTYALALYDTAGAIDRLRFHLRSQADPPDKPTVGDVTDHVRTLAGIVTEVSDGVTRLGGDMLSAGAQRAAEAFASVLPLLGEGMTELGLLHRKARLHRAAVRGGWTNETSERQSTQDITCHLEGADQALGDAAAELRTIAARLAPASARVQSAAHAHSPHATGTGPAESTTAAPPAPAAPAAAPSPAKGR
jgi:hypothetical protein